jgi:hypothetical protein
LIIKRISLSTVGRALAISLATVLAFTALCGLAAGQFYSPYPEPFAMPVTAAGPGGAIASANGVTACSGPGGAIASAGPVTAGASAVFPAAFAGLTNPVPAFYGLDPYAF